MRVVFIGCVEMSARLLRTTLGIDRISVVGVVTRSRSPFNADFVSLKPIAEEHGIPCITDDDNDQDRMESWLRKRVPESVFCFGWSYLLNEDVLSVPRIGVVGYHPAALPENRGRHPIIWALVLGLAETGSTFFLMDAGADTGDILHQRKVPIHRSDDARSLYDRLADVAADQLADLGPRLASGDVQPVSQDKEEGNYWRKRSKSDGKIDWRMSSEAIYNLVRALSGPYPGAHCFRDGEEVKVWRVEVEDDDWSGVGNLEPGKVLEVVDGEFMVKTGSGVVRVVDHEFEELPGDGSYLL